LKTFLLDSNVLLHDPSCLKVFDDNEVVIPLSVLDELDMAKNRVDEAGRNARAVVRLLDSLRKEGSLSNGVKLGETTIRVEINHTGNIPSGLSTQKTDNKVLSTALGLSKAGNRIIVVSKDINLRVKCDVLGVEAQDYVKDKLAEDVSLVYSGMETLELPSSLIDEIYDNGHAIIEGLQGFSNQFFVLKSKDNEGHSGVARYVGEGKLQKCKYVREMMGITPRNLEQKMAVDLLLDPEVRLVTLLGRSGCGKTLVSVAAALHQVLKDTKTFDRLLISRPIQPMGRDVGYLPGTIQEKLRPWMQPIYDNLELLLGSNFQVSQAYEGLIQVEPLTYIRGRSIPRSFMILDEAQNMSAGEIKTVITRMGENSKIVITGDIEQIDHPYMDFSDNGLTHIVEKFKDCSIAGHITLRKGERSKLATLAAAIL
jgi:PhoH-like ATPase